MANQVKMTFVADTESATSGFARVGDSAKTMTSKVDEASGGFTRAGDAADGAEGKARGMADTLGGATNVAMGLGAAMSGDLVGGLESAASGVADLAGGFSQFLLPIIEKSRIGVLAKAAADRIAAAGARVWAAAQWIMNTALLASPITWIVLGVLALIAVIVLIATKTTWFKDAWAAAWRAIKAGASAVWEWIKKIPGWLSGAFDDITGYITKPFDDAWTAVEKAATTTWDWLKALPAALGTAFLKVTEFITAPFRLAFNAVADLWNKSLGKVKFAIPKWVPKLGGKTWGFPQMPKLHSGGIVPGRPGQAVPIMALAGERVASPASGGGGTTVLLGSDGSQLGNLLVDVIATAMRGRGGDPAALGISNGRRPA